MFDVALRVSMILAVAWLAAAVLRRASAATRHLIWHGAFIAILVAPLVAPITPKFAIPASALATDMTRAVTTIAHSTAIATAAVRREASRSEPQAGAVDRAGGNIPRNGVTPAAIATLIWGAGTLMVALWFAVGWLASARIVRRASPADPAWQVEANDLCRRLRVVPLRVSGRLGGA